MTSARFSSARMIFTSTVFLAIRWMWVYRLLSGRADGCAAFACSYLPS